MSTTFRINYPSEEILALWSLLESERSRGAAVFVRQLQQRKSEVKHDLISESGATPSAGPPRVTTILPP
jgi:hypothetical protein